MDKLIKETDNLQLFFHGKDGKQSRYTIIIMKDGGSVVYQGLGTQKSLIEYMNNWEKQNEMKKRIFDDFYYKKDIGFFF